MPLTTLAVWPRKAETGVFQLVSGARDFFLRFLAQGLALHQIHSGLHNGGHLPVLRYAVWSTYGRAQDGWAADAGYQQRMIRTRTMVKMVERTMLVGLNLGDARPAIRTGGWLHIVPS